MALDGILLAKITPKIAAVLPARIQKIYEISNTEIVLQLHGKEGKQQLFISCHSVYNRILLSKRNYPTPPTPGNFVMVLRKYIEGGTLQTIHQEQLDRYCILEITRHNNLGDLEHLRLIVELMGKYANVILVAENGKIIDALKRIPPFENSKRMILPQAMYQPMPLQEKKDPFHEFQIDSDIPLPLQFAGFSPLLAKEVTYRIAHGSRFEDIMQEIETSDDLYIYETKSEPLFHCIALTHLKEGRKYPLFEGFDILYASHEEKERIKQITGDLFKLCKRELKHQKTKLPRLLKEYDAALDCEKWKLYGDLLFTHGVTDTKGLDQIILQDYETEQDVTVPLDKKLDGKQNAKKCYTKYQKLKKGQMYLQEQIQICQNEIQYFTGLLEQLELSDFDTAKQIQQELIKLGYIKAKSTTRKKKEEKIEFTTITYKDTKISFGKNNLQNDLLTWHTARKNEIWLHAKDYHGAHVVIHDQNPDEDVLRFAANIAAYYSQGRMSSSVPVTYCEIKNLKKIPGAKPGMVQLGSYRMLYIDPDQDVMENIQPI